MAHDADPGWQAIAVLARDDRDDVGESHLSQAAEGYDEIMSDALVA